MEQEGILKEINKMVSARDSEFQSLNQKIEMLTERWVYLKFTLNNIRYTIDDLFR